MCVCVTIRVRGRGGAHGCVLRLWLHVKGGHTGICVQGGACVGAGHMGVWLCVQGGRVCGGGISFYHLNNTHI